MPANYSNCIGCPYVNQQHLSSGGIAPVFTPLSIDYGTSSNVLLVFQAPGFDEWIGNTASGMRIPIDSVNPHSAGNRMRRSMVRKNTSRADYDITEAVQCYPGKKSTGRDKIPSSTSMRCCLRHLINDLSQKQYNKIVAFGDIAYQMTCNAVSIINTNTKISIIQPTPIHAKHPSGRVSNSSLDASY